MRKKIALGLLVLFCIPPLLVLALRWLPPPTTAYMLQSPVKPVRQQWVSAEQIAESARRAVIAAEDQKFWDHGGFDLEAMQKAYERNQRTHKSGGRVRGGSTISQQTAKNLFLWPGGGYFRKGIEATFTVLIEWLWGKDRILEVYLNIAEFGPGLYGVEAAAQEFFGKHAAQLSAAEAARLASVLPNPRRWNARRPGPYVQKRTAWILGQLGYRNPATPAQEPVEPAAEALPAEVMEPTAEAAENPETPLTPEPAAEPEAQNLPAASESEPAEVPPPADAPAAPQAP